MNLLAGWHAYSSMFSSGMQGGKTGAAWGRADLQGGQGGFDQVGQERRDGLRVGRGQVVVAGVLQQPPARSKPGHDQLHYTPLFLCPRDAESGPLLLYARLCMPGASAGLTICWWTMCTQLVACMGHRR